MMTKTEQVERIGEILGKTKPLKLYALKGKTYAMRKALSDSGWEFINHPDEPYPYWKKNIDETEEMYFTELDDVWLELLEDENA